MEKRSIGKSLWSAYWKLHDRKKSLAARVKARLDGLPEKRKKRLVLALLALFALLALYTFEKAVYDIGRNDGRRMEMEHIGRLGLPTQPDGSNKQKTPYIYGRTEE